jgi:ribonuclease III
MDPGQRRAVERILGYRFQNPRHLEAALTHGSRREHHPEGEIEDYERLEFLGDSVLQLAVTDELFRNHPSWREGELTKARSKIVSQRPLAAAARRLGLDAFLQAGASVRERPVSEQSRILSDVMEALLGAVHVDSRNFEKAAEVVRRCVLSKEPPAPKREPTRPRARKEPAVPSASARPTAAPARPATPARPPPTTPARAPDYKSQLQDLLQKRRDPHPEYRVLRAIGPEHEKIWFVEVAIGDRFRFTGKGRSKKEAEQRAARAALAQLRTRGPPRVERSPI